MAENSLTDQELYAGLIRLHILHHASEKPVYGLWIIEELDRHGYKLSAGTLYPLLHRLEQRRLLRSNGQRQGRRLRRLYRITPAGRRELQAARHKVKELFGELFESELTHVFVHREHSRKHPPREALAASIAPKRAAPSRTKPPGSSRSARSRSHLGEQAVRSA